MFNIIKKYSYLLAIPIYGAIYLSCFFLVEGRKVEKFHIVHSVVDDMIPFCEIFVIPYFIWFFYVAATVIVIGLSDRADFLNIAVYLATGMTLFIIISFIYPNAHELRPTVFSRNNIFVSMVKALYETDTPTNLLPSIHVYNSIACHIGITKCKLFKNNKIVKNISFITATLIIISTMFIKQHSFVDVVLGFLFAIALFPFSYKINWENFIFKTENSCE